MNKTNLYNGRYFFIYILSSFFVLGSVHSVEIPSAGQELRRQEQQKFFKDLPKKVPDPAPLSKEKQHSENKTVISIKEFVFTGEPTVFTEQQLQAMVAEYTGKKIFLSELIQAVNQITQQYIKKGYLLARAKLPPQDVTEGLISIRIQEGILNKNDGIKINSQGARLNTDFSKKIFANAMQPGSIIQQEQLERGALLLNDLPGVKASVNLEPGSEPGTTSVVLDIAEDALINPSITWDNTGSRLTGAYKGGFALAINDLTGYGDQIAASYQGSLDGGAFHYTNISGKIPIGYSGFKLGTSFQYLAYEAGKEFENLGSKGDAIQWDVNGEYPLLRSRKANVWIRAGFNQKILRGEALGESINHRFLNIGSLGFVANYIDDYFNGGFTQTSFTAFYGNNDLSGLKASFQEDQSATGAKTDGNFAKFDFNVRRVQRATDDLNLIANISGQIATKNLSPSEKTQLGGAFGVRAYPSGEAIGDHGVLINIDSIYTLMRNTLLGDVSFIGFYDWGRFQQIENAEKLDLSSPNNYNLSGYGVGLKVGKPGHFDINLTVARRIGNNPAKDINTGDDSDGSMDKTRFWFSTSLAF